MKNKLTLEWFYAAGMRAIRTMAQTALGMMAIGMAMNEVQWTYVASVAVVSGIFSLLTSVATNLPEVGSDGTLQIDVSNPNKDTYLLAFNSELDALKDKKFVKLSVDPNANLHVSQE